jgi:HAD superfamily hydrolase (TIGR01484 family)
VVDEVMFPLQPWIDGWRAASRPDLIRLVLLDVDGCLTLGEASPLDLEVLRRLQAYNRRAAAEPAVPAITLCTGRQEPYVEFMTQAVAGYLPAIWENGAGLYVPAEYRFKLHPLIDRPRLEVLAEIRRLIAEALILPDLAHPQPGKEVSITLYPTDRSTLDEVYALARDAIASLGEFYWVQRSLTTVEVLPLGIHKGAGARWLLDELALEDSQCLGVGDSPADIEIFRVTGLGATPWNGHEQVKAAAQFVAPRDASWGVVDILEWCIAQNTSTD